MVIRTGLAERILKGDHLAAARLITAIEDEVPAALEELKCLYPHTGKAYVVGITGAPGVGKSTLIDRLIGGLRERGMTVGVVAVDPTSPFSGGAILGDRIRMDHNRDRGVFIRSLASRGQSGGLSRATLSAIQVMDALGQEIILVETVASGQAEVAVTTVADTTIVVLVPGMGDEIQLMKAGILEVAHIFVVNKAARDGADTLRRGLEAMLGLRARPGGSWAPAIVLTEAISDNGVAELAEVVLRRREFLEKRRQPLNPVAG